MPIDRIRTISRFLILLLLGCVCLALPAFAADRAEVLFSLGPESFDEMPLHAVAVQQVNYKYYLFLPGGADAGDAQIWFSDAETVTLGQETLHSGDRTHALIPGETIRLVWKRKKMDVRVRQGSPIPAVFVSSASGTMKKIDRTKRHEETGWARVLDQQGKIVCDGELSRLRIRGNTSGKFKKKSYYLKFTEKVDLFGMGKAKKWTLIGNSRDHSLIRNQLLFAMADYVGLPYSAQCLQADVYLNHFYNGIYLLQEKVEIGKNRIAITDLAKETESANGQPLESYPIKGARKLKKGEFKYTEIPRDPEDITGGYLLEYENWQVRYKDEDSAYTTKRGKVILVKEPERASQAQMEYISSFIQGYEDAIFAEDGRDPKSGKRYDEFVDLDSLALKYILEEYSKNCDANASSQFYYKPADSESTVAFAGPPWDYDTSFGVFARSNEEELIDPEGLYAGARTGSDYWWPKLVEQPEFRARVSELWRERYVPAIRTALGEETDERGLLLSVRGYADIMRASAEMNFELWPIKQGGGGNIVNTGATFEENLDYLEDFMRKRYEYLEKEWAQPASADSANRP